VSGVRTAVSDAWPFCARLNSKAIQNDIMRQVVETAVDLGETAVVRTHRLWRDLSKVRAGLAQAPTLPCALLTLVDLAAQPTAVHGAMLWVQ